MEGLMRTGGWRPGSMRMGWLGKEAKVPVMWWEEGRGFGRDQGGGDEEE